MFAFKFLTQNARWLAGGFLLTFFSSFGQTFFISLSAGNIRSEFGLSHGEFGLLYMGATLCSALTLPWMGKLLDYFSPAQITLLTVPLLALGSLGMAVSTHIGALIITLYLLRLFGQAMMTQNALTATARWFTANRGKALSVVTVGHNVGEAVFPFLFVALIAAAGWRKSWVIAALVLLIFALPLITALISKERQQQAGDPKPHITASRDWTREEVIRDRLFWLTILGVLAPPFIGTTIFFHQIYLVELRGWSLPVFTTAFSVMALSTFSFTLIAGTLVDRFSAITLLPSFLLPLACACLILGGFSGQWSAFVFMALLGVSYGFSSTLFGAIWPELYGTKHLGSIRAVIVSLTVFGTAAGPGLTGWLIDNHVSYPKQIMAMGLYCFGACLLMCFVSRALQRRHAA